MSFTIQIGPLSIPLWLLGLLISLAVGWGAARLLSGGDRGRAKVVYDRFTTAVLIGFVAWKLSPLVFKFPLVVQQPIMLIYSPGGVAGLIAGIVAGCVYLLLVFRRLESPKTPFFRLLFFVAGFSALTMVTFAGISTVVVGASDGPSGSAVTAPLFELEDIDGDIHKLTDYRGKYVVINFWATWCPPCRAEIPELKQFSDESDTLVLGVNLTSSEPGIDQVVSFVQKYAIDFPVLLDNRGRVGSDYGVRGIPTTFIIDPKGNIKTRRIGAVTAGWLKRKISLK